MPDLDNFRDRPVQAELLKLLTTKHDSDRDSRFTSYVLVHGMDGTGKVSG